MTQAIFDETLMTRVRTILQVKGPVSRAALLKRLRGAKGVFERMLPQAVRLGLLHQYKVGRATYYGLTDAPGLWDPLGDPKKLYGTVLSDIPWAYRDQSCRGAARRHYETLDAQAASTLPVMQRVLPDAHLWFWITKDMLLDGAHLEVLPAWGFRHITIITWVKAKEFETKIHCPGCDAKIKVRDPKGRTLQMGLGRYFRGTKEMLIFAVRGKAPIPPEDRVLDLLFHPKTHKHSRKPDLYKLIKSVSKGPYLEIFSETPQKDFDRWGKERKGAGYKKAKAKK